MDSGSAGAARRGGLSRRALARAQQYMESNLGEPLTLKEIAHAAHLSRAHFARGFRISMGRSVMNYLRELRLERAKSLLAESEIGIAELSANLGFSHHSHFTRTFKRLVGICPRDYGRAQGEDMPNFGTPSRTADGASTKEHE